MIYINSIPSFRDPESYKVIPDDRVQKIEIIGGVALQDYGHIAAGDTFALTCLFSKENFQSVLALWEARSSVTFTDTAGEIFSGLRIVMKEYERDKNFPDYVMASFELWRK